MGNQNRRRGNSPQPLPVGSAPPVGAPAVQQLAPPPPPAPPPLSAPLTGLAEEDGPEGGQSSDRRVGRPAARMAAASATGFDAVPEQPAVMDLVSRLINSQRQPDQRFFLVVVPEDDWPRIETFVDVSALVVAIRGYLDKGVNLFPFLGHRLPITKGPLRFLQTPFGGNLPLFAPPAAVEEEDHGWVGPPLQPPETVIPTVLAETQAGGAHAADADEAETDNDDGSPADDDDETGPFSDDD